MRKVIYLLLSFALFASKLQALNVTWTTTNCSSHGCLDGSIMFHITTSHPTECGVRLDSMGYSGFSYSSNTINFGPFQVGAGTYTYYVTELCQPFLGYNPFPVYGYYMNTYSYTVTITEPPCITSVNVDSVLMDDYLPDCHKGKIFFTAFASECGTGVSPSFAHYLYKNGNLISYPQATSGGDHQLIYYNLDSGYYQVKVYSFGQSGTLVCPVTTPTIHITEPPCNLSVTIDSFKSAIVTNCESSKIYYTGNNSFGCNGQHNNYLSWLYKDGNSLTGYRINPFGSQNFYEATDTGDYFIVVGNGSCYDTSQTIHITSKPCTTITLDSIKKSCDSLTNTGKIYVKIDEASCLYGWPYRTFELYKDNTIVQSGYLPVTPNTITHKTFLNLYPGHYKVHTYIGYGPTNPCHAYSAFFDVGVSSLNASLNDTIKTCQFETNQTVTFTAYNGSPPYTFTYAINGGSAQTITTAAGSQSVSVPIITTSSGTFQYHLISVADAQCSKTINDTCVVIISLKPTAHLFANTINVCQFDNEPIIKFTASGGQPPYCFKYTINGVQNSIVCPNVFTADSIFVPTTQADTLVYKLIEVQDSSCSFPVNDSVKVVIKKKPFVSAFPVIGCSFETITLHGSPAGGIYNPSSPYIGPPTWYTYSITENGCTSTASATISHYLSCSYISYEQRRLCIRMFLSGYYSGYGKMNEALINQMTITDPGIADSIDLELRDTLPPYNLIASTRAALDTNGYCCCTFTSLFITGYYYLVVKSRNGLETWSSTPIHVSAEHAYYNFAESATAAFGNNQAEVENGIWAIYTGDLNQDGNIDLLDMIGLENDISDFLFGYYSTDLNGDGNIDLLDLPILEGNVSDFIFSIHP